MDKPKDAAVACTGTHLLLVAHAPLACAFRDLALHAYPESAESVTAIDISAEESFADAQEHLATALAGISCPLLVIVDVMGATPANALLQALRHRAEVPILCGLNVPMLWRALGYRREPPMKLAELASQGGLRGIQLRPLPPDPETS